jgi:predicted amidohydrolase YtcJ
MRAFVGGAIRTYDPTTGRWLVRDALVIDGATVVGLDAAEIGAGVERIDLDGATIVPAFADCHVHLTDTGLKAGERDFADVGDAGTFAARVAALPQTNFVIAGNYDDAGWPAGQSALPAVLDATHRDQIAMVVRVDGHCALLSRAALAFVDLDPALPGIERDAAGDPTGRLFLEANWRAQVAIMAGLPLAERRAADRRATAAALAAGALHLHVFLDGSIGSRTAALTEPYCDGAGTGTLMHSDADVDAYFSGAERLGLSAGVHAIGDRAIEQCVAAWERVLRGKPSPTGRHFIEHFEVARLDQIERCARLGLFLSMQPQFDAAWGGPGAMYERRLGRGRARAMNRLRTALDAGAVLVGGADSPVCRLSPLAGMQAALDHFTPSERLDPSQALTMYTYAAARFGHAETRTGTLAPRYAADFVILDHDPLTRGTFAGIHVRETWSNGTRVYAAA